MLNRFIACIVILGSAAVACGQEAWDIAKTTVGGKNVAIEYGRPTLKGRTVASLMMQLPPDRIWRAGSGPVTILSTETDLAVGGKKVPAGNYSLYMYCPESGDYALVINSVIEEPPSGPLPKAAPNRSNRPYPHFMDYTSGIGDKEVARIPLRKTPSQNSEVLIYSFEPSGNGTLLTIRWGDQAWAVEFQPAGN